MRRCVLVCAFGLAVIAILLQMYHVELEKIYADQRDAVVAMLDCSEGACHKIFVATWSSVSGAALLKIGKRVFGMLCNNVFWAGLGEIQHGEFFFGIGHIVEAFNAAL